MEIKRYDERHVGTECLRRSTAVLSGFASGRSYEITRYVYAQRVEISAIVVYPNGHFDQHKFFSFPRYRHVPGPRSNQHFPGDCWQTYHEGFQAVHRTKDEALRFLTGRADMKLI